MIRFGLLIGILIFPALAWSSPMELEGNFKQGGLIFGKTDPKANVIFEGKPVRVAKSGRFVFGFGRDFKDTATLIVELPTGEMERRVLRIEKRNYPTERLTGLPPSKVTPSEKFLKRIRKENGEIARLRAIDTEEEWYLSGWQWPAVGRVSGVYGSQRILNDIPKRPHFGLDVAAPVGTPILASTDGMVAMVEEDLFYTGGTVMIDHGHGLVSVYSHLSKLDVAPGEFVTQGTKIGEMGKTGRATGPHLDWRLNWFKERLDPELLLGPMPKN
ncbi:M23 family metallopeptidase [Sneathiella marina]|uniref:M23 family metallopeptidase n=1 Tax=Sneathiella marina TaxID=2950108 RepID=A0ABY4W893_9PROT|nr:M23 family metallopeptidase [Sneathiella marina]USG62147.1 M23 family metallopeptidase [Sneathiella marina]